MKSLSIFVDESGDFGKPTVKSPYYIVTMIIHDQKKSIADQVNKLNHEISNLGYSSDFAIHTGPLIRKEEMYSNLSPNERRSIFTKLFFFSTHCDIKYKSFVFEKKQYENELQLEKKIAREISRFITENLLFFQSFDDVILYYDNGQHELNRILNIVLASALVEYDIRKVLPKDYKLFQVADLICTLTLLSLKCGTFHVRPVCKK